MKKVDSLPTGPGWKCKIVTAHGNLTTPDKKTVLTEDVELWLRDPVECIKELVGNPAFKDHMSYIPEQVFEDPEGETRVFDEMWTGNWWWDTQVRIISPGDDL